MCKEVCKVKCFAEIASNRVQVLSQNIIFVKPIIIICHKNVKHPKDVKRQNRSSSLYAR